MSIPRLAITRFVGTRFVGTRFAGTLFAVTVITTLVGCNGAAPMQPVEIEPMRPAPLPKTYDYTKRSLKDIDESTRREVLREHSSRPAPPPPLDARPYFPPEVDPEPERRVVREYRYYDRDRHWYGYEGRRRHYRHHGYRYRPGIGNTLFYGTLGGIIGHHNDKTEEGILIGVGYGLLRDLLHW